MQERIEDIVKEACMSNGVSLYDLQWKTTGSGRLLLVRITRLGGVTIDDCREVSHQISEQFDAEDLIEGHYLLEVSSPGLERELTKKSHFISAINEGIKVTVQGKADNQRLNGILKEVNPASITLTLENGDDVEIPLASIKKANTHFDAKPDLQKAKRQEKIKELS
jgi:ribosome maturation factor RimP